MNEKRESGENGREKETQRERTKKRKRERGEKRAQYLDDTSREEESPQCGIGSLVLKVQQTVVFDDKPEPEKKN